LILKKAGITYQYDLIDVHFHITSEHTVRGIPTDIEMHMVHKKNIAYLSANGVTNDPDVQNSLLVVGTRFRADVSQDNIEFAKFNFATLGQIRNVNLNPYSNPNKSLFHYLGGLTTPTCDEILNWIVMEAVESISPAQLQSVKQFISKLYPAGNARSIKPLNQRTIYYRSINATKTIVKVVNDHSFLLVNKLMLLIGLLFIISI
jgi:carbonic anhydrase